MLLEILTLWIRLASNNSLSYKIIHETVYSYYMSYYKLNIMVTTQKKRHLMTFSRVRSHFILLILKNVNIFYKILIRNYYLTITCYVFAFKNFINVQKLTY